MRSVSRSIRHSVSQSTPALPLCLVSGSSVVLCQPSAHSTVPSLFFRLFVLSPLGNSPRSGSPSLYRSSPPSPTRSFLLPTPPLSHTRLHTPPSQTAGGIFLRCHLSLSKPWQQYLDHPPGKKPLLFSSSFPQYPH